ncbi:retrovirus-related pol polyprotein from transposon TNT 1-94 [Tanacetum coccineum]
MSQYCILASTYLINRLPSKPLQNKSLYEILYKQPPTLTHLKIIGCQAYTHHHTTDKFEARSIPSVLLGYPTTQKGYLLYNLETHKPFVSSHVNFNESIFPFYHHPNKSSPILTATPSDFHYGPNNNTPSTPIPLIPNSPPIIITEKTNLKQTKQHTTSTAEPEPNIPLTTKTEPNNTLSEETNTNNTTSSEESNNNSQTESQNTQLPPSSVPSQRKSTRSTTIPLKFKDFHYKLPKTKHTINLIIKFHHTKCLNYNNITSLKTRHLINTINNNVEPQSYTQAVKDFRWIDVMSKELHALEDNHTWTLTTLPQGKIPIASKWVYMIKCNSDGSIEKFKARLVAKGFTQKEGIDYNETFAPVAKMVTVRTFIVVVVHHNWHIAQLDINNAFFHGDLHEEVYMTLPQEYKPTSTIENPVCKLQKSLYGLKQANMQWVTKLIAFLTHLGFNLSYADTSLLIYKKDKDFLGLVIYVDDILLVGNNDHLITHFKQHLDQQFNIKDLGNLNYYLGIEFLRNKQGVTMTQRKYALELIHTAGVLDLKPSHIPIDPNVKLNDRSSS